MQGSQLLFSLNIHVYSIPVNYFKREGGGGVRGVMQPIWGVTETTFFSYIYLTFYISSVGSGSLNLFWVIDPRPVFYLQHCIYFVSANASCPLLVMKGMLAGQAAPLTLGYWTAHCRTPWLPKENNYFLIWKDLSKKEIPGSYSIAKWKFKPF